MNVDGQVFSVSFSPDGEFIAAGYGYDGHIQMFKAQTGEKLQSPLREHKIDVRMTQGSILRRVSSVAMEREKGGFY